MKRTKRVLYFVLIMLIIVISFAGCSKTEQYGKKLVGTWYYDGEQTPAFMLFNDGTCIIHDEYGTGHWSVYEERDAMRIRITAFSGESDTAIITDVRANHFIVQNDDGDTLVLWNSPQAS